MPRWSLIPAVVAAEEPLGERIGPFVFWPVLLILIGVIVWAMLRKSRGGTPRPSGRGSGGSGGSRKGAAVAETWTRPEDYREHHRVAWSADPAAFAPSEIHWPLAAAALLGICSGDPWDRLAHANLDQARDGLQEAWGIRSRGQLLSRLHWLLREGHRLGFEEEIAWTVLEEGAAGSGAPTRAPEDEADRERAWRMQQVRANARGIRDAKFEVWDLARAAMLCRAGYSLGWLSEAEAVDTLNLVSGRLQRGYSSWADLGEHFSLAGWYWGGNSSLESRQEDAHAASRQSALLDPQRGPWSHVPWSQPIPESRLLLVDALVDEELLVEVPDGSPTPLARTIDERTAARLGEGS